MELCIELAGGCAEAVESNHRQTIPKHTLHMQADQVDMMADTWRMGEYLWS